MDQTQEVAIVDETALTQEEILTREQVLVDMKIRTMRRKIFDSLMPHRSPPGLGMARSDAVALLIVPQKNDVWPEIYILFKDQGILQAGPAGGTREEAPAHLRWVLDLPHVSVV